MQTFLKQNIGFFSLLCFCAIVFLTMLFYSCGLEEDLAQVNGTMESTHNTLRDALDRQASYSDEAENLQAAQEDSDALAEARKSTMAKLMEILAGKGLLQGADRKTSQDVNSDLQRFIRLYRDKLHRKGIKIKGGGMEDANSALLGSGEDRESFGFSKYDGQWPSFEVAEAQEIFKQKQIIMRLLDLLVVAKGNNPNQPLELLGVKRELVGKEDTKQKDSESLMVESGKRGALAKRTNRIETYVFRLEVLCRTTTLRDFITQMEPPFIVSDLEVHRAKGAADGVSAFDSAPLPFELKPTTDTPAAIPIISDVDSRFVLTIEYLTAVHAEPEQFFKTHYYAEKDEDGRRSPPPESVSTFLSKHVFNMKQEDFDKLLETLYAEDRE